MNRSKVHRVAERTYNNYRSVGVGHEEAIQATLTRSFAGSKAVYRDEAERFLRDQ